MLATIRQDLINAEFSYLLFVSYMTLIGNIAVLNFRVLIDFRKCGPGVFVLAGRCCLVMMLDNFTTGVRAGFRFFVMLACSILATSVIRDVRIRWRTVVLGAATVGGFLLLLSSVVIVRTGGEATVVEGVVVGSIYGNIAGNI
jgi:hypothetical protein